MAMAGADVRLEGGLLQTEGDVEDGRLKVLACNLRRALRAPEECDIPYLLETAARELDRLRIAAGAADELDRLRSAIREHRDQRGDDRCWLDDVKLYHALDDGVSADTALPPKCDFLTSCARYWEQRQWPADKSIAPSQMTLAQLQAEVERLRALKPPNSSPSSGP
jgi:hypothetical protein